MTGLLTRFDDTLLRPPLLGGPTDPHLSQRLRAWADAPAQFLVASTPEHAGLDAAACALDGSALLATLSPIAGLLLRLRVKWQDLTRAPSADVWDCGWLRPGPEALARLSHWQPRRPTLLMVAADALPALPAHLTRGAKPLRVLLVTADAVPGLDRL
jgi:hypothetical protein